MRLAVLSTGSDVGLGYEGGRSVGLCREVASFNYLCCAECYHVNDGCLAESTVSVVELALARVLVRVDYVDEGCDGVGDCGQITVGGIGRYYYMRSHLKVGAHAGGVVTALAGNYEGVNID